MNTKARRKLLLLLFLFIIFTNACAPTAPGAQSTEGGDAAPSGELVTLHFQTIERSEGEMQILQEHITTFTQVYPEIAVEMEMIPIVDYLEKLMTAIAAGTPPDIAEVLPDDLAILTEQGALESISGDNYAVPWSFLCYRSSQLVLPKGSQLLTEARLLLDFLGEPRPCRLVNADVESWQPYPTPPSSAIIGDAELVPGAPEIVNAIALFRDVLEAQEIQINSARAVRLADDGDTNFTYTAPLSPDVAAIKDEESFKAQLATPEGLITGVMVVPEKNDFGVPAGPYLERMYSEGDQKWVELVAPDDQRYHQSEAFPEGSGGRLADDEFPTAAISYGSKKCLKCYWWGCCLHRCP